jgi:hypothetical protein
VGRDGGEGGPAGAMVPPQSRKKGKKKKKNLLQLLFCSFIFHSINTFVYFKKDMQEGNKFKEIIFLFKILFFSSLGMQNH